MSKRITEEQAEEYRKLEKLARNISESIDAFEMALLESSVPESVKLNCSNIILGLNLFGLAYRLHPQTEWIGGDSSGPKNFVTTNPHIANEVSERQKIMNCHILKVKYIGPTSTKGGRIKISSERFGDSVTIGYNHSFNRASDQALAWLGNRTVNNVSSPFHIIGTGEGNGHDYVITDTFKGLKEL